LRTCCAAVRFVADLSKASICCTTSRGVVDLLQTVDLLRMCCGLVVRLSTSCRFVVDFVVQLVVQQIHKMEQVKFELYSCFASSRVNPARPAIGQKTPRSATTTVPHFDSQFAGKRRVSFDAGID